MQSRGRGNSLGRIGSRHTSIVRRPVLTRPKRHRRIHRSRAQAIDANAILNGFERAVKELSYNKFTPKSII